MAINKFISIAALITVGIYIVRTFDDEDCALSTSLLFNFGNENYRYFQLDDENGKIKSHDDANHACQICLDGTLLQYEGTKFLKQPSQLTWIGVHRPENSASWFWSNGSEVDEWDNYTSEFKLANIDTTSAYSVLAYMNKSRLTWVAISDERFKSLGRMYAILENTGQRDYHMFIAKTLVTVCQRPYRPQCHYWNITEKQCRFDELYGCHGYGTIMYHVGDEETNCSQPTQERFAFACPTGSCISCKVSQWLEWSSCSSKVCTDGIGTKRRKRKILSKNCQEELFRISLIENVNCAVLGCDILLNNAVGNLSLV